MANLVMGGRALFSVVAALWILNIALAGSTNAPKITDILANEDVKEGLRSAWKEGFLQNPTSYQLRGGWIYADSNYPDGHKYLLVQHASKDRSPQGTDEEIDLDNPEKDVVLESDDYRLVADFHTHPLPSKTPQRANPDDIQRAYKKGVPGIVVTCSGVFYFGPDHRASMDGPTGYPETSPEVYNGQKDIRFGNNEYIVQGQCNK